MKKVFLAILGIGLFSTVSFAQKGNNQVSVGANLALPTGDSKDVSKAGFGGTIKGLYGIGNAGQITLTTGYVSISAKDIYKELLEADKISSSIVPILVGYRHHFKGFFVEPQVGYGIYGAKIKGGEFDSKDSNGAFTWAAGIGYVFNNTVEVGAQYQSGHKDGESNGLIGFRAAYNFSL
jgi:hypothetical protein